jgi:hypothetical protein
LSRGSSASVLIIPTILVIGVMMIYYVSDANIILPVARTKQVNIVVPNYSAAMFMFCGLMLTLVYATNVLHENVYSLESSCDWRQWFGVYMISFISFHLKSHSGPLTMKPAHLSYYLQYSSPGNMFLFNC